MKKRNFTERTLDCLRGQRARISDQDTERILRFLLGTEAHIDLAQVLDLDGLKIALQQDMVAVHILDRDSEVPQRRAQYSLARADRDNRVLAVRLGFGGREPLTLKDVGKVVGMSASNVRRIEGKFFWRMCRTHRRWYPVQWPDYIPDSFLPEWMRD